MSIAGASAPSRNLRFGRAAARAWARPRLARVSSALLFGLTALTAATLPFEPAQPIGALPWLELNHLKLLVAATAVVWTVNLASGERPIGAWYRGVLPVAGTFVALALLSAVLAPSNRSDALRFVGRLVSGAYVLLLTISVASTPSRLKVLMWSIVLGAGASAILGIGEALAWTPLEPVLGLFKLGPTRVGGELRVSGSFQYATIAAMFLEVAALLAIGLAAAASSRIGRGLACLIACGCTAVVVLTLTRAGMATLAIVIAALLVVAWLSHGWRRLALPAGLVFATLAAVSVYLTMGAPAFGTRLTTENDDDWYAATYTAPDSLSLTSGARQTIEIVVRNTGQAVWTATGEHPFRLGFRWLSGDGTSEMALPTGRVSLPTDVPPNAAVTLQASLEAPAAAGEYRLAWGMLQEGIVWFRARSSPDAETAIHVGATDAAAVKIAIAGPRDDAVVRPPTPRRSDLWTAALRMLAQHPLLGVGPDNFRHVYGTYLGLPTWDERVHANNLYLEMLADVGVPATAVFGGLLAIVGVCLVRCLRAERRAAPIRLWAVGLAAAMAAFLIHGLLDYFLEFTPTYLLFWLVAGLAIALERRVLDPKLNPSPGAPDAVACEVE